MRVCLFVNLVHIICLCPFTRERMGARNSVVDFSRSHQQKRVNLIPPSSSQTLWSSEGNSSFKHDKDKGVNVQVILRCRWVS